MKICIPSSNRCNEATTPTVLINAVIYVPEEQKDDYEKKWGNRIVGVPEKYMGITKTRNFILRENKDEDVLFVDDDVRECGVFCKGERVSMLNSFYNDTFEKEFKRLFDVCRDLGFKIWGCENGGSVHANHPTQPFSFEGTLTGNLLGIINDGEFSFDEKFKVKEDYEIVLNHYKRKGGQLKARNFYWRNKNWSNAGGCVDYRTDEMEDSAIKMLSKKYGGMIVTGKRKNKHAIQIKWG